MKKKIIAMFGTRPDAIKMAPLILELKKDNSFETIVCSTGQHKQMLKQVLDIFDIKTDYDLDIMEEGQTINSISIKILSKLDEVLKKEKPDLMLVHGDTTTGFISALSGFYNQIKIGHVEAGLRTWNKYGPFPEEINRKLIAGISDIHFSPTENNKKNLLDEGINQDIIHITGNTGIDSMRYTVKDNYIFKNEKLNTIDFDKKIILVTAHRRENLGDPMINICNAIKEIVNNNKDIYIIFPVHLNPIVRKTVFEILGDNKNVLLIDPLDVEDLHNIMNKSFIIATDSGGLQEEGPYLGKPVLVLRNETERPEAIEAGTALLAGTDKDNIYKIIQKMIDDDKYYNSFSNAVNPYGDGNSSVKIIEHIKEFLNK